MLASQLKAIEEAKPGVPWNEIQNAILNILVTGLVDLKILKGNVLTLIQEKAYLPFYMHRTGHWLGLDVHDAGHYAFNNKWRKYFFCRA